MNEEVQSDPAVKRGPGRPKKVLTAKPETPPPQNRFKMKAKPNWETIDPTQDESPDRFHIAPENIPEGMSLQWVTDSVLGQSMSQHRATFEKRGWTPVHQTDFDSKYDGMFMAKGAEGEINLDGMVLMARPKEITDMAREFDRRRAREQVAIKEAALGSGDLPGVSLDPRHRTAIDSNRIAKSYERIEVPQDSPKQE